VVTESIADRHKAENEAIFRGLNQRVQKRIDAVNAIAAEEGERSVEVDADTLLHFYCECADENCQSRVLVSLNVYNAIHKNKRNFIIRPGHEVAEIEDVTKKGQEYWVVTKHEAPPESSDTLHVTDVHNS